MKQPETIKEDNGYRVEYFCPVCDAWIATRHFANDDTYIYGVESSDSNGICEPCRCCKETDCAEN